MVKSTKPQTLGSVGDRLSQAAKSSGKAFYKWLGITAGNLGDIPGNHINIGIIFLERGDAKEALRRAKLASWMRTNNADAQALMTRAYAALGDKLAAEQAYTKASQYQYHDMLALRDVVASIGAPTPTAEHTPQAQVPQGQERQPAEKAVEDA